MKKLTALCLIAAIALIVSCQPSAETKAELEKQAAQTKALEAKVETLTADLAKHIQEYHAMGKEKQEKEIPLMKRRRR